uniref:Ras association domain family member 5 n=1 Tax=Scleropages formosus TaxID=113540 RepID=A0A8C9TMM0_SCLFO
MASVSVTVPQRSAQHLLDEPQLLLRDLSPVVETRGILRRVPPSSAASAPPASLAQSSFSVYCGPPGAEDGVRRCLWQNGRVCQENPTRGNVVWVAADARIEDAENIEPERIRGRDDAGTRGSVGSKSGPPPVAPLGTVHRSTGRRSSQVTVHRDLDLAALSGGALPAGWSAGDRVTQGRSGVVRKQRHAPPRREAWSIFQQEDPRVRREKGEGHLFGHSALMQDWCDACSRQVRSSALKCRNCSYTCHLECKGLVQLDCNQRDCKQPEKPSPLRQSAAPPRDENAAKEEEERPKSLSDQEIRAKIQEYNAQVTENGMKLGDDGIYTGFIKVHLKLRRPVTVLGTRPEAEAEDPERRTSFYLPSNAVKQLHISSSTTAGEVIQGLLNKFMVLDNPRKFALYRQTHHDGQGKTQPLQIIDDLHRGLVMSREFLYIRQHVGVVDG